MFFGLLRSGSRMAYSRAVALLLIAVCILAAGCTSTQHPATITGGASTTTAPVSTPSTVGGFATVAAPLTTMTTATIPTAAIPVTGSLVVRFLDVSQGDAILLQSASGKTMLVDAGPTSAGSSVVSTLRDLGITSLDVVVATHPHEDHIGGMAAVLAAFPVKEFIDIGYPHTTSTCQLPPVKSGGL